jgi:superfamily II DNA or RNA helicase
MTLGYIIGLSATIPKKLKQLFKYRYHSEVVSCDIIEAIEDDVLPEPQILLFPLMLDNRNNTEKLEYHPKASGPIVYAEYRDIKKYKYKTGIHAIITCTQKQKLIELDADIAYYKREFMKTRHPGLERSWLWLAGKRLEYLANCKNQIVSDILKKLDKERTITFCKTIEQSEVLGKNCIHSQNKKADEIYERFNKKKINHITAVNILNENANLVDCKYAIFANLSSSEVIQVQRTGRALRHKSPVIIIPYYQGTREQEIVEKQLEGFNKDYIKVIHSIQEI